MLIHKCDICEKELVKGEDEIIVGNRGFFSHFTICKVCGKPVVSFMKKHKLIKIKK